MTSRFDPMRPSLERVADAHTIVVEREGLRVLAVPRFRARVVAGPDSNTAAESEDGRLSIGTAEDVSLRLTDPTVSRYHVELEATSEGIALRDFGSTNGTHAGSLRIADAVLQSTTELGIGRSRILVEVDRGRSEVEVSRATGFGRLIGAAPAMRAAYTTLQRAAPTTAPVLITGESGTGKELAARGLHEASARAAAPFEVLDCGGLTATLAESELFGHERGAFTSAVGQREGAFVRADGGTLFLDEIGELPVEVQPKLLRALGEGQIRRVGGRQTRTVDVRVVAATNRDLRQEVNAGRFRADLYYRLAVITVRLPPLRHRLEDLPMLVRALLDSITEDRGLDVHVEPDASLLEPLAKHDWPGNVRELRNYLEQLLILRVPPPIVDEGTTEAPLDGLDQLPMREAKRQLLERFERDYVTVLLAKTDGNVAEAARRAGVDRGTLFRTIRRHGLRSSDD